MPDSSFDKAVLNLKKIWGFDSFKGEQEEAVRSILNGKDTLILFPTGGGKSLCYQLPATVLDGLTVVISPLISLMQDQVDQLGKLGIPATFINSTLQQHEIEQRLINARNGMYSLLYCSPERLETPLWQYEMPNLNIQLVAVDEAHCISEWGHDFRPSYRKIAESLESIRNEIVWVALTATATPEVQDDIVQLLKLKDPAIISGSYERANLKWWVLDFEDKDKKLLEMVVRAGDEAGIVYAGTRKDCNRIAHLLEVKGKSASAYHSGIEFQKRKQIQNAWISNRIQWIVATNAFGMGINKPDCRYVFHYVIPNSIEAYYQEAGRAGRDGDLSYPVLLYNQSDYQRLHRYIEDAYPNKEILQKVYDALCDSLELAVGSSYEETFQVSIEKLIKRNKLPVRIQKAGLRVLDRYGILTMITDYKSSYGVYFALSYGAVLDVIESTQNKQKAVFIDRIFRLYGPESQNEMVFREVDYLTEKLQLSPNQILKGLEVLQNEKVLFYEVRDGNPLIKLHEPRYAKLSFTPQEIEGYRNVLLKKLDYMRGYVDTQNCRSKYIRSYFGEKKVPNYCGNCDICIARTTKSKYSVSKDSVQSVCNSLKESPQTNKELQKATGLKKTDLVQTLGMLIKEGIISTEIGEQPVYYLSED